MQSFVDESILKYRFALFTNRICLTVAPRGFSNGRYEYISCRGTDFGLLLLFSFPTIGFPSKTSLETGLSRHWALSSTFRSLTLLRLPHSAYLDNLWGQSSLYRNLLGYLSPLIDSMWLLFVERCEILGYRTPLINLTQLKLIVTTIRSINQKMPVNVLENLKYWYNAIIRENVGHIEQL